ncbi:MAG: helix-turn-helix domain-containing protein [Candidatus Megaira endosymbiont of Mesostigma viride]|jgi:excisionase family DNA binding protein|nr:MAG: helix-turn-helix domain-containing protein [Candidatus Megaira endosymbiont of Mesostigma viride]HJK87914.1 helix-turn-helix domain-containing protein [Candidatus Megaira endosymbiont of Mesostigma viride]
MAKHSHNYSNLNQLLTRKQAAELLGVKETTLAHWKCTGRYNLSSVKIGRLVKYRMSDLEQFIEKRVTTYE